MTSLHVYVVFCFQSRRHPPEPMSDFLRRFDMNFKFIVLNY